MFRESIEWGPAIVTVLFLGGLCALWIYAEHYAKQNRNK